MKLLLDTHLLLWAAGSPGRLSAEARALVEAPENELLFSGASLWEIAIKRGLGREDFRVDVRLLRRGLLDNGYGELPVGREHAVAQFLANVIEGVLGQYRIDVPTFPPKTAGRTVDLKGVNQQAPPDKNRAVDKAPATTPQFV